MAHSVSIGTAWSEAAAFVRREKKLLAPLVLALIVLPAAVSQLLQPGDPLDGSGGFDPWVAIALVALLAGLAGQMAVSRLAMGWHGSIGEAMMLALKRLPTTVAALILYFLGIGLLMFPIILVLTLVGGMSAVTSMATFVPFVTVLAAAPRILLAPAVAMDRSLGPWALVKATWRATRGHYWSLFGFFLLFLIASLVFAVAAASVVGSIATLLMGPPAPMSLSRLSIALAAGLVQGVVATIYGAMIGRMVIQLPAASTSGT